MQRSAAVKVVVPDRERVGVGFSYLPPDGRERTRVEEVWRHAKHEARPVRSHRPLQASRAAVAEVLTQHSVPPSTATGATTNLPEAA